MAGESGSAVRSNAEKKPEFRVRSNAPFLVGFGGLSLFYILFILLMVLADFAYLFKPVTKQAAVSHLAGVVSVTGQGTDQRTIIITDPDSGEVEEHPVPFVPGDPNTLTITTEPGEVVRKGEQLTNGEMIGTDALYSALTSPQIQASIKLSLISCTISALLSLIVAVPIGYLMSRFPFRGKSVVDTILDIPIVLPPLVIGLSLIILFRFPPFQWISNHVYLERPAVIIAQFAVACAFSVRTMRVTFDQIPTRFEHVALTCGCNRSSAFWRIIFPQARHGLLAAGTLAWARSLGEFGPILLFAGSTKFRTEVLPTSVYLEMQAGNIPGMLAISLIMIVAAMFVLLLARTLGLKEGHL